MLSRVSGFFCSTASQLANAFVDSLLSLEARTRSNGHRWSTFGLMPTTKTRENVCLRDTLSVHALSTEVPAHAESHAAKRNKKACAMSRRSVRLA
jgi:hypothetical protein